MAYKLSMNHPDFEKGTEFDVGGFLVPNGSTVTVKEADERALVARHGQSVKDALGNHPYLKIEGTTELSKDEVESMTSEGGEG